MKMFGLPTDESMRPLADGNWQELVRSMDVCTGAQALIFEQMQQAGIGPEAFVLRHPHPGGVDPLVLEQGFESLHRFALWYAEGEGIAPRSYNDTGRMQEVVMKQRPRNPSTGAAEMPSTPPPP